jgi:glycoprotein endo-alpha-1,2-mannosidase
VDQGKPYQPPQDLGSTFWPSLGPYSSHDDAVIEQHFEWMAAAKIGSVCVTWWGENTGDENGEDGMTDLILPRLLDAAAKFGMKISFHIEPYRGRNAASVRANLQYIYDKHADHPAFSPVFFVYDSYLTPPEEWATLLSPTHPTSIRHDTQLHSAVVLGLVVEHRHLDDLARASFDGVYTYFASNTFVYGSTPRNWPSIAEFTQRHHMKFVPCVGPGYDDEVIRPWNAVNTKPRRQGQYYDEMWEAALRTQPAMVGVTSWNEHHEGTSIEPCVPHTSATRKYLDYSQEGDEMYYVSRTAYWVDRFQHPQEQVEPET